MPIHPLDIHTRYILLDQLSHVFFFEVPRKFQSPQRITSLGGFLAGESSKYFRARKVTLGHVEEVVEGNPTLWLCLKVTSYRGWYMGTGVGRKLWGSWRGRSQKAPTAMNELMPCVVWLACWKWWKTCESGKPCTSLRGLFMKLSASSLSTFYVGMGGVQNARPNRDEWRSEEDF